jgi:uncharacterized protein (DUF697 family)/tellurite resistance protein
MEGVVAQEQRRTLAALRVLISVAQADGNFSSDEKDQIKKLFVGKEDLFDQALHGDIDMEAELTVIGDDEAYRRRLYRAAYAVVYADGRASTDEVAALRKICADEGETTLVAQVLGETMDTLRFGSILPVADPVRRRSEIMMDTSKYAVLSGVVGALPVPIFSDALVVTFQTKLVVDIGNYWGQEMDSKGAVTLLGSLGLGVGIRVALNTLAKLVPGWGSAVGGATSFASTFAVGEVANAWFASGQTMEKDAITTLFKDAKSRGNTLFEEKKSTIMDERQKMGSTLKKVGQDLGKGNLSVNAASEAIEAAYDGQA